jgi:hypothetical protein
VNVGLVLSWQQQTFLQAGFRPIGAEVLLTPADSHAAAESGQL